MGESRLIIIEADDWVTIYKDNIKVWDGHTIDQFNGGLSTNVWKYCEDNGIKRENVSEQWIQKEDEQFLEMGALPDRLDNLNGKYV